MVYVYTCMYRCLAAGAGVSVFDFSSRQACETSCRVLEAPPSGHGADSTGRQCVVMGVGDCILEPFWPEGLGINRGFHTAFDAIFVIEKCFSTGVATKVPHAA